MKFVDQRTDPIIRFGSLVKGEMFLCDGQPFLKIQTVKDPIHDINAIDLVSGDAYRFGDDEVIEKVWNCELVVKG